MQLSNLFKNSYLSFESYPRNIVNENTYLPALEGHAARLDNTSAILFKERDSDADIRFRDWHSTSNKFEKQNVYNDVELRQWLGDHSSIDPATSTRVGDMATKRDPKCRFIFIYSKHSRALLHITRNMLARILSYHQVMPGYLEFVSVFGIQSRPRDLRFSGFCEQTALSDSPSEPAEAGLGRSGRQYQLSYNLKTVDCTAVVVGLTKENIWFIRQAAFHHQFDISEGTTLWIVTKGDLELKDRTERATGPNGRLIDRAFTTPQDCFKSSLGIHLLYCHWSTESWRSYIQWLEDVVDQETLPVYGPRAPGTDRKVYTPDDLQTLQGYEDKINEMIMILEANIDVLSALRKYYLTLLGNKNFPMRKTCREDVHKFATRLNDMSYDLNMQITRAKLLVRIAADRKSLVLQYLQSQATEKMEKLTEMAQKEAISMRIITVVTLIYLPATFVSTFFSTDIVKYQNQNGSRSASQDGQLATGSFSELALFRWLQVTLPLTAITLAVVFYYFKKARKHIASTTRRFK